MDHGPEIILSNGNKMPQVGLGTWQSAPEDVKKSVKAAVHAGYRLIDTAACYENEEAIGDALKELFEEGVVKRQDVFITTKLWVTHLAPEAQEEGVKDCLKKLQLDYVDLLLAHMPVTFDSEMKEQKKEVTVEQIWQGLEGLHNKGYAKAIGVSNFNVAQIERIMAVAKTPIHNVQVELYLYLPQFELHQVCKKYNISLTSYATLGSPGRVEFTLKSGAKLDWAPAPSPMEDKNVKEIANKYNKTPAQVLLRWAVERGIAIIPKSVHEERVKENFKILDFTLSDHEMALLNESKHSQRLFGQDFMEGHPEDAFADERKKDE